MMNWVCKHFDELTTGELYDILQLRAAVFVVEQNCPYQDLDGKDLKCCHLMGYDEEGLVAYTRLVPPGISYEHTSIGRVVVSERARRIGAGKLLMKESIACCERLFGRNPIKISAQLYLKKFYESFGFVAVSDVYLEDDIEHIAMIRTP
ncbi:MAG: GNAT family N-acetyltransferase [Niabella sp.]